MSDLQMSGFTKRNSYEVYDAHKQWASRPADEAVFSVDDLISRTKRLREASSEVDGVPWSTLSVVAIATRVFQRAAQATPFSQTYLWGVDTHPGDTHWLQTCSRQRLAPNGCVMSVLRNVGIKIHKTRFPELGYAQVMRGAWRFVDMSSEATIGYNYPSKAELLADLPRFAKDFGCSP